jgi:hypothetical protein
MQHPDFDYGLHKTGEKCGELHSSKFNSDSHLGLEPVLQGRESLPK